MIIVILAVLGLVLGSFVNALVYRLHMQSKGSQKSIKSKVYKAMVGDRQVDLSISRGRSMCVHCGHELAAMDLVPVFSWAALGGKCRYCRKPISWQYPLVELVTAVLFVLSYIFWPFVLSSVIDQLSFAAWLVVVAGFVALVVYDVKWMLLPNRIIYPLLALVTAIAVISVIEAGELGALYRVVLSAAIGGGIFLLLFQLSGGKWIGGGDVKLGLLIGLVLQDPYKAFMVLLLASALGTLLILPGMLLGRVTPKTRIPFGPFLIVAAMLVMLFGPPVVDWYKETVLLM